MYKCIKSSFKEASVKQYFMQNTKERENYCQAQFILYALNSRLSYIFSLLNKKLYSYILCRKTDTIISYRKSLFRDQYEIPAITSSISIEKNL